MYAKPLPNIIKENCFDFKWDIKKVWGLNLPVTTIPVSELDWILDIPFWSEKGEYDLKPREVINHPDIYPVQVGRYEQSDIKYPIDIMLNLKGKWLILDGLHRLVKLIVKGETKIQVRKIPREYIPKILQD